MIATRDKGLQGCSNFCTKEKNLFSADRDLTVDAACLSHAGGPLQKATGYQAAHRVGGAGQAVSSGHEIALDCRARSVGGVIFVI
jgi:hypothetical protein